MTTAYRALAARLERNAVHLRRMMNNVAFGGDGLGITIKEPTTLLEDLIEASTALTSALDEIERLERALEQIDAVCADNAPETCRHDLALKFVADVAHAALHRSGR